LRLTAAALGVAPALLPLAVTPEPLVTGSYNLYGTPGGLLEMPSAEMAEDAEVSGTIAQVGDQTRTTLSFQLTPRISGSFRYARIPEFNADDTDRFDRSFDVRLLLLEESTWLPAVAIGLQDFVGSGVYSSEYVVATKAFGPVRVTGGLGWGRLGTHNDIGTPFGERPDEDIRSGVEGGTANFDHLFQGPAAPFGGVSWQVNDRLSLKAEYSSDAYVEESAIGLVEVDSPWNYGLEYELNENARIQAAYLYGNEAAIQLNLTLNPRKPASGTGNEEAPLPVIPRPSRAADPSAYSTDWINDTAGQAAFRQRLGTALSETGIEMEAIALRPTSVEIRIDNRRYHSQAQAIGRTARILSRALPDSIETFTIVPVTEGVPDAAVSLRRSDLEALENEPARAILARTDIEGGGGAQSPDLVFSEAAYPNLTWSLGPFVEFSLFDPDSPIRGDVGLRLAAEYQLAPGWVAAGSVRGRVAGNLDEIPADSDSVLPRVRTDFAKYYREDVTLESLTFAHYGRPAEDLYSRVTVGYLEPMFAGVSTELLWKRPDSRLGIGAEVNYVQQREFDGGFGLRDYDVWTGHVSAYYDFGNGFQGQLDVGRYLAGDEGATIALDREFDNGWRVGAFATFTDVSAEDFGEGSFDKGIRLEIPLSWFTGQPSRTTYEGVIRPLTRDGGARLEVDGRLYDRVKDSHSGSIGTQGSGGRFWR